MSIPPAAERAGPVPAADADRRLLPANEIELAATGPTDPETLSNARGTFALMPPARRIPPPPLTAKMPPDATATAPSVCNVPPLFTVMAPPLFTWKPLGVFRTPPEIVNELKWFIASSRGMTDEESTDANVSSVQAATDPCPPTAPDAMAPEASRRAPPASVAPFAVPPLRKDSVPPPDTVILFAVPPLRTDCSPLTAEPFTVISVSVPPEAEALVSTICFPARRPPSVAL